MDSSGTQRTVIERPAVPSWLAKVVVALLSAALAGLGSSVLYVGFHTVTSLTQIKVSLAEFRVEFNEHDNRIDKLEARMDRHEEKAEERARQWEVMRLQYEQATRTECGSP